MSSAVDDYSTFTTAYSLAGFGPSSSLQRRAPAVTCGVTCGFLLLALAAVSPSALIVVSDSPFPPSVLIVSSATVERAKAFLRDIEQSNGGPNCGGQFSQRRFALLFLPGTYDLDVQVAYYVQVAGLGRRPEEVTFTGPRGVHALNCGPEPPTPHVGKPYADVGALDVFWRSVEHVRVAGPMVWAVSQAAPLRNVQCESLTFSDGGGWSSGGYAAGANISGALSFGTQQQAFIRNSAWETIDGLPSFNLVALGTTPALRPRCGEGDGAVASVPDTPAIAEKPRLLWSEASGGLVLAIPTVRRHASGLSTPSRPHPLSDSAPGERARLEWRTDEPRQVEVPLSDTSRIYVATDADSAAAINSELGRGEWLLIDPDFINSARPHSGTGCVRAYL